MTDEGWISLCVVAYCVWLLSYEYNNHRRIIAMQRRIREKAHEELARQLMKRPFLNIKSEKRDENNS